jgi:preprotein translocase subunit SecA
MNTQRLAIYARRRAALMGTNEEVEELIVNFTGIEGDARTAFDAKKVELGTEFVPMLRRLLLQAIDTFWLEHLETMDYLRRSVSLRAYGQRDPLIEYRREGLMRFRSLETDIAAVVAQNIPNLAPADDARIRAEEEKVRAQLHAAGAEDGANAPAILVKGPLHGRNDMVVIKKGTETQTLKYKKAEPLLSEGWEIIQND